MNLSSKLDDGSQLKSLISKKHNEIENLKSHLKIPNVHLVKTTKIHQVEKEKRNIRHCGKIEVLGGGKG